MTKYNYVYVVKHLSTYRNNEGTNGRGTNGNDYVCFAYTVQTTVVTVEYGKVVFVDFC